MSTAQFTIGMGASAPVGADILLGMAAAAEARRTVVIEYTAWDGRESQREVDVYGLVFHSGRWNATGYDRGREDARTFRLDRIASVRESDSSFDVPADFDATTQVVSGIAAVPWAHEVTVVLHTTLAEASERLPKSVGRLSEHADGVLLETRAERLDGMARLLAGLGWDFDVIAPGALRGEVLALSASLRHCVAPSGQLVAPSRPESGHRRKHGGAP